MPCTPIAERASRTSSSLNGLMTAVTSFMVSPVGLRSERPGDEADHAVVAPVLAFEREVEGIGVGALVVRAGRQPVAEVPGRADLPHRVVELAVEVAGGDLRALVALVADEGVQRE